MGSEVAIKLHVAGIWEILLASGAIQEDPVNKIEIGALLQTFAYDLPYKLRVKYHYWITEEDDFNMKPGFINFQRVEKGRRPQGGVLAYPELVVHRSSSTSRFSAVSTLAPISGKSKKTGSG